MKRIIITALATAAVLIPTSAYASAQWSHMSNGVWCKTQRGAIACIPTSGRGYGVAINSQAILVMDIKTERSVFQRYQP
jgi:hypothetical protein